MAGISRSSGDRAWLSGEQHGVDGAGTPISVVGENEGVTPYDDGRDTGDAEPRDTEPTRPLSQQPPVTEPAGTSWLPPLPARSGARYDAPRPLPADAAREIHTRVPWWIWATVCGLALALGLFGGAGGFAPRAGPRRRHTGTGLGRARRRRHGLDPAVAGRERLGGRGRAAAPAQHRPDLRGVRGRGAAAPPARDSCSTGRVTSSPTTTSCEDAAEGDGPIEIVDQDGNRYDAEVVGRSPVYDLAVLFAEKATKLRPAALGASRVAAGRRRGRRDRLPARAELHGHRRHRQRPRPAGHDRRLRQRLVVHQRRADRRRDQPGQLRRPAGRPQGAGGRRQQRHRHHRRRLRRRVGQHRRRLRDPDRAGPDHRRPDPQDRRGALPGHRRAGADRRRTSGDGARIDKVNGGHARRRTPVCARTTWSSRSTASGSPTASP